MKNSSIFSRARFALLAALLTVFIAVAISPPPSYAAGLLKRGHQDSSEKRAPEKDSNKSDQQEKERKEKQERDRQAQQDRDRQAQQERDRQAQQERDRQAQQERDRQARQERDRQSQQDRDRQAQQERDRQAQQDRDRQAQQTRDRLAQQERDRQAQQDRDRQAQQERDRQAQQERDRQAQQNQVVAASRQDDSANRGTKPARVETNRPAVTNSRPQISPNTNTNRNQPQRETARPPEQNTVRIENRQSSNTQERSSLSGIFDRSKRGDGVDRDSSNQNQSVVRSPSPAQTPSATRTNTIGRVDNKPKRVESNDRSVRASYSRQGNGNASSVFERVFETRRNWNVQYRNYDHRSRPHHHNGYYYYRWPVVSDPYHYGYYSFRYVRDYTYPSIYYYYSTFPYIHRNRVVILSWPQRRYVYVPINLYDDYYLSPNVYSPYAGYNLTAASRQLLRETLEDIREAWEDGDHYLLMRHVRPTQNIHVFFKGSYSYSIDREDYRDMTLDAMETIDTYKFHFDRVKMRAQDEVVAYGYHEYYNSSDRYTRVYVSYTLERRAGNWFISEVGSSPDPLDR